MTITRAMISSTCFDLAPVREEIGNTLSSLGFQVLASESSSFPVLPHLTPIENCQRAARDGCDLLVLIVGGRRGSLAPGSDASVTNIEYREARQAGKPIFVFVDKRVSDLVPVWQKNPTADFSPAVDYPRVFEFIGELQRDSRWLSTFSTIADIDSALRNRTSQMFRYLLDLSRGLERLPLSEYQNESAAVRNLLITQPHAWEYRLFAELLIDRIRPLASRLKALRKGREVLRAKRIDGAKEYMEWIQLQMTSMERVAGVLNSLINEDYKEAMRPQGTPADLTELLQCADRIGQACSEALQIEVESRSAVVPSSLEVLHNSGHNWGGDLLTDMITFAEEFYSRINVPGLTGSHHFQFTMNAPKGLDEFSSKLQSALEEAVRRGEYL